MIGRRTNRRTVRGLLLTAATLCSGLLAIGPSAGASTSRDNPSAVALTLPGAQLYGYATPVIVIDKSMGLGYTNLDVVAHDFVQDVGVDGFGGPGTRPWCRKMPKGKCPLFWSRLAGLGDTVPVMGLAAAKRGRTYSFYCTIHLGMKGKLVLAP
jgi:hypothetical protein